MDAPVVFFQAEPASEWTAYRPGSKTYLHGWAGYGEAPVMGRPQAQNQPAQVNYAGQQGPDGLNTSSAGTCAHRRLEQGIRTGRCYVRRRSQIR